MRRAIERTLEAIALALAMLWFLCYLWLDDDDSEEQT